MTIESLLRDFGYAALVVVLLLDSSGVPWPTEATLVLTGAAAARGHLNVALAEISSLGGAALGSSLSYYLGRRMGPTLMQRIAAFFRLTPQHLEQVDDWFAKHGHRAVLFGRLVPFVRCFTGFPAGVIGMPFGKYLAYSLVGYFLYITLALGLGYGGLSLAKWLGDLEIALWILAPLAVAVAWFKWGRKWAAKRRVKEKGKGL